MAAELAAHLVMLLVIFADEPNVWARELG